jgi:FAD-NAD(P)-binding
LLQKSFWGGEGKFLEPLMRFTRAQTRFDIAVIEPRAEVGRGVAFSATDRDHRINAPAANHVLTTDDAGGFHRWLRQTGRVERDPEMVAADGSLFLIGFLDQSSKFLKPVDAGDTIYPALELTEFRAGRSTGVVALHSTVFNHRREEVLEGMQRFLIRRRAR